MIFHLVFDGVADGAIGVALDVVTTAARLVRAGLCTVSPSLAHLVASYLVLEQRESQARYMIQESLRTHDPAIQVLERFVLANLNRQISTEEMARATAMSPRTLARRLAEVLATTPLPPFPIICVLGTMPPA